MAWDEWEQLKSEAAARQSTQMRLNQIPADGGGSSGGSPDLASNQSRKRAAANAIDEHIKGDTSDAGAVADEATNAAEKAFAPKDGHGWVTSTALKKAHDTWGDQVRNLMNRLSADSSDLRGANKALHNPDFLTGTGLLGISIDGGGQ